jgi:hypothetical protein
MSSKIKNMKVSTSRKKEVKMTNFTAKGFSMYDKAVSDIGKLINKSNLEPKAIIKELRTQLDKKELDKTAFKKLLNDKLSRYAKELNLLGFQINSSTKSVESVSPAYKKAIINESLDKLGWDKDKSIASLDSTYLQLDNIKEPLKLGEDCKDAMHKLTTILDGVIKNDQEADTLIKNITFEGQTTLTNMNKIVFSYIAKIKLQSSMAILLGRTMLQCKLGE